MLTHKLHIRKVKTNKKAYEQVVYDSTGLVYKLYNNLEMVEDSGFIRECIEEFHVDRSIYDFSKAQALDMNRSREAKIKKNSKQIEEINKELDRIAEQNAIERVSRKERTRAFRLNRKKNRLADSNERDMTFGGKALLRKITKHQQDLQFITNELRNELLSNPKIKKSEVQKMIDNSPLVKAKKRLVDDHKKKFRQQRQLGVYLVGRACEGGNRKIDFDLNNNRITFKLNRETHIEIEIDRQGGKIAEDLQRLQYLAENNMIALTVRLSKNFVCISFDEQKMNGYHIDWDAVNKEIKRLGVTDKEQKKEIYKAEYRKQEERFFANKISTRYAAVDLNPEEISLVIADKINDSNEDNYRIIAAKVFCLGELSVRLGLPSHDPAQVAQNEKKRYELSHAWKEIFELVTHYRVGNFIVEELDLSKKAKDVESKSAEFNRLVNNVWHRERTKQLIEKYTNRLGIKIIPVNPVYSSLIGNLTSELYDPIASALEILRRGITKYFKNAFFPSMTRIAAGKLVYLQQQNIDTSSWKNISEGIKKAGLRYRNKEKNLLVLDHYLNKKASKVKIFDSACL